LRFEGSDRHFAAVGAPVGSIKGRRTSQQIPGSVERDPLVRQQASEHGHQVADAIDYSGIDDLAFPGFLSFKQCRRNAERKEHRAAAEIAHEVERRDATPSRRTDRLQRARQGDVIDIMPHTRCQWALLSPPRHSAVDQTRIACE
jgi:hypothetical protein